MIHRLPLLRIHLNPSLPHKNQTNALSMLSQSILNLSLLY
jgi:hypothetical protein